LKKKSNMWGGERRRAAVGAAALCFAAPLFAVDLHQAVRSGDLDVVKELVAKGENVNERDTMGATPLHDAAWSGRLEIAAFLLERGADVRAKHAEGGSEPLAYAAIKNNRAMAELLLAREAPDRARRLGRAHRRLVHLHDPIVFQQRQLAVRNTHHDPPCRFHRFVLRERFRRDDRHHTG